MMKLITHTAHRALHEGHQLMILILVEGRNMKGLWLALFLLLLVGMICLQELWPEVATAVNSVEKEMEV